MIEVFGFKSMGELRDSLVHFKWLGLTVPVAGVSTFFENYLGLKALTVFSFVLLLGLELVSGILVSILIKKEKLKSRRFGRFGFKVFIWMLLFFIIHSFKMEWKDKSVVVYGVFDWLLNLVMVYVCLEYFISVLENVGVLSGRTDLKLIRALRKRLNKFLELDE